MAKSLGLRVSPKSASNARKEQAKNMAQQTNFEVLSHFLSYAESRLAMDTESDGT